MPIESQPLPALRFVVQAPDPVEVEAQPGARQFWLTNYVLGGGGGGVTDHGALTGLADDDHPQYLLDSAVSAFGLTLIDDADAAAARATLGLGTLATLSSLAAAAVTNTPAGGIAAANVQAALNELDADKFDKTGGTVTGDITLSRNGAAAAATLHITGDAGQLRRLFLETGGLTRWELRCDNAAESGANVGSNFRLIRFDDSGTVIDVPLIVNRATGLWTIAGAMTIGGALTATLTGSATSWATGRTITTTGDVTGVSGAFNGTANLSFALTIAGDAVTNAKLANMAAPGFKGRITAGAGDPEDLTGTQATTLLDTFTPALKGLAPLSGGGTANFLRADGAWAAPAAAPAAITEAEIDFGATPVRAKTFTVTAAAVTPASKLIVLQSGAAATGRSADENEMDALILRAVPGSGQFTLYADCATGRVRGKYKINYMTS